MKTPFQYEIISRLKKAREDKNFTQASIAKHLGISPGQLGNIESYKQCHKFTLAQIMKICDLLEVDIVEILLPKGGKNINPKDVIEVIVKYQDNIEHINVD